MGFYTDLSQWVMGLASKRYSQRHSDGNIHCDKTYWRCMNENGEIVKSWKYSEMVQLVDFNKIQEIARDYISQLYPNRKPLQVSMLPDWNDYEALICHVVDAHFNEVRLSKPILNIFVEATDCQTIIGIRHIVSGEDRLTRIPRVIQNGDSLVYTIQEMC